MNRDSQNQSKQQTADKQNVAEVQVDRVDSSDTDSGRPKRLAASSARDRIREQLSNEQNYLGGSVADPANIKLNYRSANLLYYFVSYVFS